MTTLEDTLANLGAGPGQSEPSSPSVSLVERGLDHVARHKPLNQLGGRRSGYPQLVRQFTEPDTRRMVTEQKQYSPAKEGQFGRPLLSEDGRGEGN